MAVLDKYERRVLISLGATVALFIFSILYAKGRYKSDVPECLPFNKAYTEPKVNKIDSTTYQVFAVAQMWQFQPAEIYVPVGSVVDFFLTSKDVVHGFDIAEKNANMMAVYGNINKTTVKFEKPGVYNITCHEYCGIGHQNMQARVIVNYPEQ
ncbi:MAG: cytochrome c oxidase subunit II [Williamsia sp.]|nr:cytochrome c oxidase subunit II [Williamsia sp.]